MGICLGTAHDDDQKDIWNLEDNVEFNNLAEKTPPIGQFSMPNTGKITFEKPHVPVIFILGGPGSGRITHTEHYVDAHPGTVHINMAELLEQYTFNNVSKIADFSSFSSKIITEALMLEIKLSPKANAYLITGYPRNMRDAVEYSKKIKEVSGVILISWRQKILERQIDYGAKLGKLVLPVAKTELNNFFKSTLQVVDFYDQNGILIMINGERYPKEVYKDFQQAVNRIIHDYEERQLIEDFHIDVPIEIDINSDPNNMKLPQIIYVIGGPGSNKSKMCNEVIKKYVGWTHFSFGEILRNKAKAVSNDSEHIKTIIISGKLIDDDIIIRILDTQLSANINFQGIIISGYPRNLTQMDYFEEKYNQKPHLLLLDCSKMHLGRGNLDDNIASFRNRLEVFHETTLPMVRKFDDLQRLTIIDGDTANEATNIIFEKEMTKIILRNYKNKTEVNYSLEPKNELNKELDLNIDEIHKENLSSKVRGSISNTLNTLIRNVNQINASKVVSVGDIETFI